MLIPAANPPVLLTPAANLPTVSLTPVANLSPVSTTQGKMVAKFATVPLIPVAKLPPGVVDTGGNLPVLLISVVHLGLRISPRIFEKNSKRS